MSTPALVTHLWSGKFLDGALSLFVDKADATKYYFKFITLEHDLGGAAILDRSPTSELEANEAVQELLDLVESLYMQKLTEEKNHGTVN